MCKQRPTMHLSRGISAHKIFRITEQDTNEPVVFTQHDAIELTAKREPMAEPILWKRTEGNGTNDIEFTFSSSETAELEPGRYYYDVEVIKKDGKRITYVKPSLLEVTDECIKEMANE